MARAPSSVKERRAVIRRTKDDFMETSVIFQEDTIARSHFIFHSWPRQMSQRHSHDGSSFSAPVLTFPFYLAGIERLCRMPPTRFRSRRRSRGGCHAVD